MLKKFTLSTLLFLPLFAFSQEREEGGNSQLQRANWEKLITKDPKTGQIPRNELEKSRTEMYRTIQKSKSSRVQSAIPNIKWAERGPNDVGGRTRAMLWDPNDATKKKVWVGGVSGGLWFNPDITDEKSAWQKVNDLWDNIAVGWIAADPSNPKIMYVGTGERGTGEIGNTGQTGSGGAGVWKTIDAGTTWTRLASTIPDYSKLNVAAGWREVYKIIVNAKGEVFALNYGGVFRSNDGGATWTVLSGTNAPSNDNFERVSDMEMGADGILYVAEGSGLYPAKFLKSTDATVTAFKDITPTGAFDNGRVEFAIAPSTKGDAQVIYAVSANSGTAKANFFLKSMDAGTTWTPMKVPVYDDLNNAGEKPFMGDQGSYDLILGTHETNPNALYAAGVGYSVSVDGGDTWLPKRGYGELQELMHVDNHAFMARPGFPDEAIFGNDGGVYYAPDWASSGKEYPKLQKRNRGYNVTQFFSVDINSFANSGTVVAGTQDNGTKAISSAYGNIGGGTEIHGGDGGLTFIDKLDSNIVISHYTHVTPKLHKAGSISGENFDELTPTDAKRGAFINPADYDSQNHTLYENYTLESEKETKIIRYQIKGTSPKYTTTSSIIKLAKVEALTLSFIKLGKIQGNLYVATNDGDIYKATGIAQEGDLTVEFTKIMDKTSTSEGNVSSMDFGKDENTMIVTKSNYNVKSVFYTIDGGATWISKDESSHGLPNVPIRYALINPKDTKQVLLATELGVWSTTDITVDNPKWEPNNTTLANVRCDMMKYRASDETVALATHGRGIFTTKINQILCANAVADAKTTICNGTTASLVATCELGTVKWFDATGATALFTGSPFITPALTANTTYKVRCDAENCPITFTDVTVTVNPVLEAPVASDDNIKFGTSTKLTATCTTGTPNWYSALTGGNSLGSGTLTTPELEGNKSYYVACETGGKPNCVSVRTRQVIKVQITLSVVITPIQESSSLKQTDNARIGNESNDENSNIIIDVYPNPTTGLCNWKLQSKEAAEIDLLLLNLIGNEQLRENSNSISQIHEGTIDMSKFNTGAYILKFKVGEKIISKKVIKN